MTFTFTIKWVTLSRALVVQSGAVEKDERAEHIFRLNSKVVIVPWWMEAISIPKCRQTDSAHRRLDVCLLLFFSHSADVVSYCQRHVDPNNDEQLSNNRAFVRLYLKKKNLNKSLDNCICPVFTVYRCLIWEHQHVWMETKQHIRWPWMSFFFLILWPNAPFPDSLPLFCCHQVTHNLFLHT